MPSSPGGRTGGATLDGRGQSSAFSTAAWWGRATWWRRWPRFRGRPEALICASAIGYYAREAMKFLRESSALGERLPCRKCAWVGERGAAAGGVSGIRVGARAHGRGAGCNGGAAGGFVAAIPAWGDWAVAAVDVVDPPERPWRRLFPGRGESQVRGTAECGWSPNPVTNRTFTRELAHASTAARRVPRPRNSH